MREHPGVWGEQPQRVSRGQRPLVQLYEESAPSSAFAARSSSVSCSFSVCSAGKAGSSSRLEMANARRKASVVRYRMGRPGTSSRPASSIRPFSAREFTVPPESTPRSCSTNARVTGWRYATIVNTSSAAGPKEGGRRFSVARRISSAKSGRLASCSRFSNRTNMMPRCSKSYWFDRDSAAA